MFWFLAVAAAAGWILAVLLLAILPGQARRRLQQAALKQRSHVEPYLLRRGTEANLQPPLSPTEPSQEAETILGAICEMSDRLIAHERAQVELGDTVNMAVSDTMPLEPTDTRPTASTEK